MRLKLMALVTALVHMVSAQTRGGSVLKQGENEDSQSVIVTARSRAFLSCESGDMVVKVNFTQPFRGLMYAHKSRNSPCRIHGTGGFYYELRIPLKGCGTWQESPRMFVNNITIRFHPALELEEDETKTVVCRYPPPLTPSPGSVQVIEPPTSILPTTTPTRVGKARLSEVEILIIICLLLFLSLLILGIGIAYFCLKRRNIRIIRKSPIAVSSAPPSQITRLSSSNLYPPSSLLSSVLGHTVRIPRAVPYSAPVGRASALSSPEHQYEDYPASTSTAETSSGEISETSVSSSSLSEDQTDASKYLLTRKGFPRSILSIPKAILRRNGTKRWKTEATIHQSHSKSDAATQSTSVKKPEMEDQTVTTMLEPENHFEDESYFIVKRRLSDIPEIKTSLERTESERTASPQKVPIPVYAQVHKQKKSPAVKRTESIKKSGEFKGTAPPPQLPGPERRQRQILTVTPEVIKTKEEVTKNTTMVTSVRREIAETRILTPLHENLSKKDTDSTSQQEIKPDSLDASSMDYQLNGNKSETSTLISNVPKLDVAKESKSLLIRDVADIYLTTTVETELTEQTTTVSRDIFDHHVKSSVKQPVQSPSDTNKEETQKVSGVTDKWNVVIRQKQSPLQNLYLDSNLDASSESNGDSSDEPTSEMKPQFDVKIRTISPEELKPKTNDGMINIPPLEMPATVNMLKEALMPKKSEIEKTVIPEDISKIEDKKEWDEEDKSNIPSRTVRWLDDVKVTKNSTVSSSDSFQSAESLRERSSSEVLEVAPTLPSQQKTSSHTGLERSSSEITTSPDDQVRWVGGVVPVLESLSPEFLANIPVVIQGGFFNRQKTTDKDQM